jgi:IMP dehydrogenase
MKNIAYTFSDVLIQPKYSEIESRSKVDISTKIGNCILRLPILSANMKTITGAKMAATIARYGGLGILHRFCTIEENVHMLKEAFIISGEEITGKHPNIGVSIGVKDEEKKRVEELYKIGARIFCIDVAHGHHILVKNMIRWIKGNYNDITVIAGNIATWEAALDLAEWGADAVKVGIGPGSVCQTREKTGVGVPQLTALENAYSAMTGLKTPISIISDGGIVKIGDIPKALRYADAVMVGSLISGTAETPGGVYRNPNDELYKVYGGSASGENKGENRFVEGMMKTVKFNGKVKYILRDIEHGVQSAFSYVGANNLAEFQQKCDFLNISNGGRQESKI